MLPFRVKLDGCGMKTCFLSVVFTLESQAIIDIHRNEAFHSLKLSNGYGDKYHQSPLLTSR